MRKYNIGQNRYSGTLQIGYQSKITDDLNYMLAFDTTWYGKNSDYGANHDNLTQAPLNTAQLALKYQLDSHFSLAGSYFYTFGGDASINDVSNNTPTRLQRYLISGFAYVPDGTIVLQYGGDIQTENGYKNDQHIAIRYILFF